MYRRSHLALDLLAHSGRNADLFGLGMCLQARRDVDTVAQQIVTARHHVAQIEADPELHPPVLRQVAIAARGRRVTEYKQQGAPIDFRILDPYAGEPNLVALMQRAPHPYSALLFIDWILSEDGQTRLADAAGRISIRKGIKHKPWVQELFQKDFVFLSPSSIGPNLTSIIDQYNQTFGIRRSK